MSEVKEIHRIRRSKRALSVAWVILCSVALAPRAVMAQPDDSAQPGVSAQVLIDRTMAALGGREAIAGLRSLSVAADCVGPDGPFRTDVESFRPDLVYFRQRAGERATEIWSTTERTWTLREASGAETLGDGVRTFVKAHEFHFLILDLETRFSEHRLGGVTTVGEESCQRIEMKDESGLPAAVCLSESGSLPLSLEMNPVGAEGPILIRFDQWREVEGIRYFHSFELTEGPDRTFSYLYDRLEPNTVSADRFVEPTSAELQAEQEALLEILRGARRAHLSTDAALLSAHIADGLVEVYAGEVSRRDRSEVEAFFHSAFEGATYDMWEDDRPPLIRISPDAQMAWVLRRVRVSLRAPDRDGGIAHQGFVSAYTATYEKQDGDWKMTSVTSTFVPR